MKVYSNSNKYALNKVFINTFTYVVISQLKSAQIIVKHVDICKQNIKKEDNMDFFLKPAVQPWQRYFSIDFL